MMITIYGLPVTIKYQDLKVLIKQECNISDFILDYLVSDGEGCKKVRVGLTDDTEGSQLMKCLNGYRLSGHVLRLVPVGKSAPTLNQPQTYPPRGNFPRNDYSGQTNAAKPVEQRPTPWSTNQWTANPVPTVNTYNYQQTQALNAPYVQTQTTPAVKQFDARELATNRAQPHTNTAQSYNYPSKTNLISLGPHRNATTLPAHIPEASTRMQTNRYPQNYETPDKPILIMKDNFQGPQYMSMQTANYQNQQSSWTGQQIQKPYEKQSPMLDKKYDERKYSPTQPNMDIPKEAFKYDRTEHPKYAEERRQSSERHIERQIERLPVRNIDRHPDRHHGQQSERHIDRVSEQHFDRSTERHVSRASERNIDRPSDRHIDRSSDRHIDRPSDRHIDRPSDQPIDRPPDRHIDRPSDRHIDRPSDRYIDRPSDRHIDRPSDRHIDRSYDRHMDRSTDRLMDRPSERNIDQPYGRNIDRPSDRHIDRPSDRCNDRSSDRNMDKQTDRHSSGMQRISPSGQLTDRIPDRRVSPKLSRMDRSSPTSHRFSPNRHMLQTPRKVSPHRRVSPSARKEEHVRGRRPSPTTHSPMARHPSRQSPGRMRHDSPTPQARYSPRQTDKPRDYAEQRVKDVRPAYESQASKAAMYSGGYRQNVQVDVQYPRKDWQDREKPKNIPEDRRDAARMQKFDIPRASDQQRMIEVEKKRSRSRASRSPRRERSPVRDRFRRHSPSPRSPRRSWALEKRRSPEAREPPPPPSWPGQDGREQDYQQQRSKFPDREIEKKIPIWEDKKCDDFIKNNRRNFEDQRIRKEVPKWKPLPQASSGKSDRFVDEDRFQKEDKYPRKEFESRRILNRDDNVRKSYPEKHDKDSSRSERDGARYKPELTHKDEIYKKREEYAGRIEEKKKEILHKQEQLQKEIDEVYKRAVDFTKKAEMYKKGEMNKDYNYKNDRRDEVRDYEEFHQYSYEDDQLRREDARKEFSRPIKAGEPKSSNFGKSRDPDDFERKFGANAAVKIKRIKAVDEISEKILNQYGNDISSDFKKRLSEELKLSIAKILVEMFGDKDVSFIEMLVKFNARHTQKDEERIFEDVMFSLPNHYRSIKRTSKDDSGIPAKISRRSAEPNLDQDEQHATNKQMKLGQREIFKVKTNQTPEKKCKKEAHKLEEEIKRKMKTIQEIIKEANTVKREVNAVKKEPNIVKKEDKTANPVKQEANVQALVTISQHDKGTPIVVSKLNQDEVDSPEESQLELNTLMSHVLEKELRNVVIQIWKCLPDAATADVERFVAERLRDGASEEIKNVLGLNVTKRILNVHNPLFVKIQFSGRPENGLLSKFLQTYNITSFKRIDRESNTFAAKLDTISAFDNICTAKDLKCGSAHLTVTPCYKFKNCPNNLNTVYANTTECENYLEEEKSEKASDSLKNNDTNVAGDVNKDFTDKKQDQDKPKQEETSTIDKSKENKTKAQKISKPINKNKSNKAKSDKAVIKKTDKANKIKITTNNSIEYDDDMFEEVSEMDPEFDDEMNDEEILALISGGVVLDECIGSDQE